MNNAEPLGLGIDAGGTFTDGAVVNLRTGEVLSKSKTPTLKDDLAAGIRLCLDQLDPSLLSSCVLASLSTTFATNAIVEGKGARAGAVLLGFDDYDVAGVQAERKIAVPGRHDVRGREVEPLDAEALREALRRLVDCEQVQAIAISGMGGALNPAHELEARRIALRETGLPVVCGHELSMELNAIKRGTTAYLNARLLPVVVDLIHAVEGELRARCITAPIVVVRSDGSLMSAREALSHPIHTIFSGPAASAIGALYLSGLEDAVVVDIGGTTTDILFAEGGEIGISKGGSVVSGFSVSTPSVAGYTTGFGGDSHVRRDRMGRITIGPERVVPICVLSSMSGAVDSELERMQSGPSGYLCQPVEFYLLGWVAPGADLTARERQVLGVLQDGPKSRGRISELIGCPDPSLIPVDRLERAGIVMRSGLTPTDVLHAVGRMDRWNGEASRLALNLYARDLGITPADMSSRVLCGIRERVVCEMMTGTLDHKRSGKARIEKIREFVGIFTGAESEYIKLSASYVRPVIGIGAPVAAYLPDACRAFGMDPVIPEHSEVANAVGAVAGRIIVRARASVDPMEIGYSVHTPLDCRDFDELAPAEEYAAARVREYVESRVRDDYEGLLFRYDTDRHHRTALTVDGGNALVDSTVSCTAVCISIPSRSVATGPEQ